MSQKVNKANTQTSSCKNKTPADIRFDSWASHDTRGRKRRTRQVRHYAGMDLGSFQRTGFLKDNTHNGRGCVFTVRGRHIPAARHINKTKCLDQKSSGRATAQIWGREGGQVLTGPPECLQSVDPDRLRGSPPHRRAGSVALAASRCILGCWCEGWRL